MTHERNDDRRGLRLRAARGREQPSGALGPSAFMQQLLLKRCLRRLTCPAEMADPAQPSATADSGKRRAPIEWRDKYSRRAISQSFSVN